MKHRIVVSATRTRTATFIGRLRRNFRRTSPLEIDFSDGMAPLPHRGCGINLAAQIACRVFGRMQVCPGTVGFCAFDSNQERVPATLVGVRSFFNHRAHDPEVGSPFPPHLIPHYLNGDLAMPSEEEGKEVVFIGIIWTYLRDDGHMPRMFAQGFGPDGNGTIVQKTYGPNTIFGDRHVFAVRRPEIKGVPYKSSNAGLAAKIAR